LAPKEILLPEALPEGEILAEWLSNKKGKKVHLIVPQRQSKAELLEMVQRNAQYELERSQRFAERNLQAMQDLAEILDLPELPRRIEGYDISHIQGSNAVASQVVFIDGIAAPQNYRHYNIKNPEVRILAIDVLSQIGDSHIIQILMDVLKRDTESSVRRFVATTLGYAKRQEIIPILMEIIQHDTDDALRASCVSALGYLGNTTFIELIVQTLQSDNDLLDGFEKQNDVSTTSSNDIPHRTSLIITLKLESL